MKSSNQAVSGQNATQQKAGSKISSRCTKENSRYYLHVDFHNGTNNTYNSLDQTYRAKGHREEFCEQKGLDFLLNLHQKHLRQGIAKKSMLKDRKTGKYIFVELHSTGRMNHEEWIRFNQAKNYFSAHIVVQPQDQAEAKAAEKKHPFSRYVSRYNDKEDAIRQLLHEIEQVRKQYKLSVVTVYHQKKGKIGRIDPENGHFIPDNRREYDAICLSDLLL